MNATQSIVARINANLLASGAKPLPDYIQGNNFGVYLDSGADSNAFSFSTMTGTNQAGLYAFTADSNTVTQSYLWGASFGVFLSTGSDYVGSALPIQANAIRETAIVFGGKDANGYATRISVLVGASTTGAGPTGPTLPGGLTPPVPGVVPASGGTSDADLWRFLYGSGS